MSSPQLALTRLTNLGQVLGLFVYIAREQLSLWMGGEHSRLGIGKANEEEQVK